MKAQGFPFHPGVADLDGDAVTALAAELDGSGATARGFAVDVAERAGLQRLLDGTLDGFGEVHVLANNAARTQARPLMEVTAEELEDIVRVNLHDYIPGLPDVPHTPCGGVTGHRDAA